MSGAIELASWYLSEAMRLTGAAAVSREEQEADELRRWICERWATLAAANKLDTLHLIPSYVTSYGPASMRSTAKVKAALAELARLGWLVKLEPNSIVDGKPRRLAYRIVDG